MNHLIKQWMPIATLPRSGLLEPSVPPEHRGHGIFEIYRYLQNILLFMAFRQPLRRGELKRWASGKEVNEMTKSFQKIASFAFGIIFLLAILAIALFVKNPTPFQYLVFRVVLSLSAAGVAAMLTGFIEVTISNWIRAGGALAVFLIVFFYNPASLFVQPLPDSKSIGIPSGQTLLTRQLNSLTILHTQFLDV